MLMLLCKDCKWAKKRSFWYSTRVCVHPKAERYTPGEQDLVTGKISPSEPFLCAVMRLYHHSCGEEGRLFEAKKQ